MCFGIRFVAGRIYYKVTVAVFVWIFSNLTMKTCQQSAMQIRSIHFYIIRLRSTAENRYTKLTEHIKQKSDSIAMSLRKVNSMPE